MIWMKPEINAVFDSTDIERSVSWLGWTKAGLVWSKRILGGTSNLDWTKARCKPVNNYIYYYKVWFPSFYNQQRCLCMEKEIITA